MPPPSTLSTLALAAALLHGLLALALWQLLRHRHPARPLGLWVTGALLAGLATTAPGWLPALWPSVPAERAATLAAAIAWPCLLGATLLRIAGLRMELGRPLRRVPLAAVWLLGGLFVHLAGPTAPGRLVGAAVALAAALVFAGHAVALGRRLGTRIGHGLAAAELLATGIALLTLWPGAPAAGDAWPWVPGAGLPAAVLAALFGHLGYLGLVLLRSRADEQAASAAQWAERLRREAAEDRSASLRDLLRQRDALAAGRDQLLRLLAHEIRQPLHNASGALQAARTALGEPRDDRLPRASERLQRAQDVLAEVRSVLDHTLAAAHLLDDRAPLSIPDTPLAPLLQQVLADLPAAQRQRVQVAWQALPERAELEPGLVRLALRNLLRNAFSHGGAAVAVRIDCTLQRTPPALVLAVDDDGVGLPPDWTPDRTPERPPADGRPARGLGLHLVREVMARHGGRLQLQPRQPHGVAARLVFPQHRPQAAAGPLARGMPAALPAQPATAGGAAR